MYGLPISNPKGNNAQTLKSVAAVLFYKAFAVYALGVCGVGLVCADNDFVKCTVALAIIVILARSH